MPASRLGGSSRRIMHRAIGSTDRLALATKSPTGCYFEQRHASKIQGLAAKFPNQQNREFLRRNREFVQENREFERAIEQSDFRMIFWEGTPHDDKEIAAACVDCCRT